MTNPNSSNTLNRDQLLWIYDKLSNADKEQSKIKNEVANILWLTQEEIREREIDGLFKKCINKKTVFELLNPWTFKFDSPRNSNIQFRWLLRTLKSIWVRDKAFHWDEWNDTFTRDRRVTNYGINYKSWLWEKLQFTWEEIEKLTISWINYRINKLLALAIEHVNKYFSDKDMITWSLEKEFKSSYYDSIHILWWEQNSAFNLLKIYYRISVILEKLKKNSLKNENRVRELEMAQFEIQRIFWLAALYNDREKNHEFENLAQDRTFIWNKLWEILHWWEKSDRDLDEEFILNSHNIWINGNCPNTTNKTVYITKWVDSNYTISNNKPVSWEYIKTDFNSTIMRWRTEFFSETVKQVDIRHIAIRDQKDAASTVDKFLMKHLSSFTEILDQKWIFIVVDSLDDVDKIESILTNELWTRETSWSEPFKLLKQVNELSSNEFQVKKWILKISYKAKDIKQKIKELADNLKLIKLEMAHICEPNEEMQEAIKQLEWLITYLRARAKKWTYNIEVEVQVFDMGNYIKAELDDKSAAYHWKYKYYQRVLDIFPKLFPTEIYWEDTLERFIKPIITRRYDEEKKLKERW